MVNCSPCYRSMRRIVIKRTRQTMQQDKHSFNPHCSNLLRGQSDKCGVDSKRASRIEHSTTHPIGIATNCTQSSSIICDFIAWQSTSNSTAYDDLTRTKMRNWPKASACLQQYVRRQRTRSCSGVGHYAWVWSHGLQLGSSLLAISCFGRACLKRRT